MAKDKDEAGVIAIQPLRTGSVSFGVLGTSPLFYNAMSHKTRMELLIPKGRKNRVERAATLKHDPFAEYRASVYAHNDDSHPTRLMFPAGAFKAAMKACAVRIEGVFKTEVAQLTWVEGRDIDIYGVPMLDISMVRSAGQNKTPDPRTRAVLPQWCARLTISYVQPQLSKDAVAALIANAGILCGIGDGRQEKGYGNGQFTVVGEDNPDFRMIVKEGGRKAQDAALASPQPINLETERMLTDFGAEVSKRREGLKAVA